MKLARLGVAAAVSFLISMWQSYIGCILYKLSPAIRITLTVVAIIWICNFFYQHRVEIAFAIWGLDSTELILAMIVVLVGLLPGAWAWQRLVKRALPDVSLIQGILVYLRSSIGKYTPGGTLAFAIQHRLLKPSGAKPLFLLRVFVGNAVAACFAAALLAIPATSLLFRGSVSTWFLLVAAITVCLFGVACWFLFRWHISQLLLNLGIPTPRLFLETVMIMLAAWTVTSLHLVLLSAAVNADPGFLISAYALSALVGLLFAILPGALGIRDGVLLAALSLQIPPADAGVIALLSRVLVVFSDVTATAGALVAIRWISTNMQGKKPR